MFNKYVCAILDADCTSSDTLYLIKITKTFVSKVTDNHHIPIGESAAQYFDKVSEDPMKETCYQSLCNDMGWSMVSEINTSDDNLDPHTKGISVEQDDLNIASEREEDESDIDIDSCQCGNCNVLDDPNDPLRFNLRKVCCVGYGSWSNSKCILSNKLFQSLLASNDVLEVTAMVADKKNPKGRPTDGGG
eukprot:sb/3471149/